MKLIILISHLFHRYQFLSQFLRGINFIGWSYFSLSSGNLEAQQFLEIKPVMISKSSPKFKELKRMLRTETISFHFHGASDLQYVLFLLLHVFFYLVCDPKLILRISGTFQQTYRKLHRKTEEADNAVKVVLSKLSSCCDELGKMDLDDSTIANMCDMAASMEAVERQA